MKKHEFTRNGQKGTIFKDFEHGAYGLKQITITDAKGDIIPDVVFMTLSKEYKSFEFKLTKEEAFIIGKKLVEYSELELI